jgi:Arc-like DNA binding domain
MRLPAGSSSRSKSTTERIRPGKQRPCSWHRWCCKRSALSAVYPVLKLSEIICREMFVAYRKSLVQVRFRLREDILRRLEREAKRHDRSTNDEIARRLEQSLEIDNREDQTRQAEAMLMASMVMQTFSVDVIKAKSSLASMSTEQIDFVLRAVVALGGPEAKAAAMAAIATKQGRAAALEALQAHRKRSRWRIQDL